MKYTADEARQLKAYGEIPDNGRSGAESRPLVAIENNDVNDAIDEENCAFEFDQI